MNNSALVAVLAVVAVAVLVLVSSSANIGLLELAVLAAIVALLILVFLPGGEILRFETSAAPQEVVHSTISLVGTHRRWATLSQTDSAATFAYQRPPSKLIAFLLLLCFLVPGIVYVALAGKKESLALSTTKSKGTTVVQATSNGWRGRQAGRALRAQLETAPIASPQPATE